MNWESESYKQHRIDRTTIKEFEAKRWDWERLAEHCDLTWNNTHLKDLDVTDPASAAWITLCEKAVYTVEYQ